MPTTKTLKQIVLFQATPERVYDLIMNAKLHRRITRSRVRMSSRIGGRFSVYGGGITGKNIELVPGKLIVQEWRIEDDAWPAGHVSRVTFRLAKHKKGTRLSFIHSRIPQAAFHDIKEGWNEYYWRRMKALLRQS